MTTFILYWIPYISTNKGIVEGYKGRDLINRENLNEFQRSTN